MGFLSIKSIIPVGTVFPFAGTTAPDGWMMCDGRSLNNVDYPELFAAIGYSHGGNLSSAFNIPDYRGRFLRGSDNMGTAQGAASRDPDRASRTAMNSNGNSGSTPSTVGSVQVQATRKNGLGISDPGHEHIIYKLSGAGGGNRLPGEGGGSGQGVETTFNNRAVGNLTGVGITDGDNETRPINAYVNYIIKT